MNDTNEPVAASQSGTIQFTPPLSRAEIWSWIGCGAAGTIGVEVLVLLAIGIVVTR